MYPALFITLMPTGTMFLNRNASINHHGQHAHLTGRRVLVHLVEPLYVHEWLQHPQRVVDDAFDDVDVLCRAVHAAISKVYKELPHGHRLEVVPEVDAPFDRAQLIQLPPHHVQQSACDPLLGEGAVAPYITKTE